MCIKTYTGGGGKEGGRACIFSSFYSLFCNHIKCKVVIHETFFSKVIDILESAITPTCNSTAVYALDREKP